MANQRKMTIKERAQWVWEKHKGAIIYLSMLLGLGIYIGVKASRPSQRDLTEEEFVAEALKNEEIKDISPTEEQQEEWEKEDEALRNDPERKLTEGGYIRDNSLYEADSPNALCNEVPLASLGSFGQDMIDKLKKEYPNYEEIGPFDPETAVADIFIDFGHACWLAQQEYKEKKEEEAGKEEMAA